MESVRIDKSYRPRRHSLDDTEKRSFSEGARRADRRRNVTRHSSKDSSIMSLDVRCACQYYKCDSLLPERFGPTGIKPIIRISNANAW